MIEYITDPTFGINSQALAILHLLSNREPDFAEYHDSGYSIRIETKPWYNGRERGLLISMDSIGEIGKILHIAVFEHRNSDEIICLKWETDDMYDNHPDNNAIGAAYKGNDKYFSDATFKYGEIEKCANWIYDTLADYYIAHHKYLEPVVGNANVSNHDIFDTIKI